MIHRSFATEQAVVKPRKKRRFKLLLGTVGVGIGGLSMMVNRSHREKDARESKLRTAEEVPVPGRQAAIDRLKQSTAPGQAFDVLVVGGGATGAGVALDAALRGLNVACVEQEDFASGTSSKSTKLLWAGSRYLVKGMVKLFSPSSLADPSGAWAEFMGTFKMVMGCFRERTYMLQMNPHITSWIPIAVPMDKWILWPPPFDFVPAAVGPATGLFVIFFKMYDALGLWSAPSSYVMSPSRAQQEFPQLHAKQLKYVTVFYEGVHNDARTNLAIALTASMKGACVSNYTQVKAIIFDEQGKACGVRVADVSGNGNQEEFEVRAKQIVYCGGPFTDGLRQLSEGEKTPSVVNGSGGTHIILPAYYCPRHIGMVDMATSRGSFLFYMPWEGYTLVGTTDVKAKPDLHHEVPEDDIQYLLSEAERYLSPKLQVRRRDVMSAWYGIRPLCVDPHAADQSSVSRDHIVSHHPTNGITFVSGGKWTTWREMAEDCLDQVIAKDEVLSTKAGPCQTLEVPLLGTGGTRDFPDGWHENLGIAISQQYDVPQDVANYLARTYGTRSGEVLRYARGVKESRSGLYKHYPRLYEGAAATTGYPYLEAEVLYAVDHEYAISPADILARRTRLAFVNSTAARLSLPRVVQLMGDHLGWDAARRRFELQRAEDALSRDFAGPVPTSGATVRRACAADVKDVFDSLDEEKQGQLSQESISKAAVKLGFPLAQQQLQQAMKDMDRDGDGFVNFPEFLSWWNSEKGSLLAGIGSKAKGA